MNQAIGICSLCGGDVVLPTHYMSVVPPKPTCESCGAVAKTKGPVVPMQRRANPDVFRELTHEDRFKPAWRY